MLDRYSKIAGSKGDGKRELEGKGREGSRREEEC